MSKHNDAISFDEVRRLLSYDQHTGEFIWRVSPGRRRCVGSRAGSRRQRGKIIIMVRGVKYQAHRLAWLWMTGLWPQSAIDHKDLNPGNNAWLNLREASDSQNAANRGVLGRNKLGVKGVRMTPRGKYRAQITVGGRRIALGNFATQEQARGAYQSAANRYFGVFARD